jgi:hypothetical protein
MMMGYAKKRGFGVFRSPTVIHPERKRHNENRKEKGR